MRYETVAEAIATWSRSAVRLALTERLAVLFARTPDGLLTAACYLCQDLIATEFAEMGLGQAESSPSARSPLPRAPARSRSLRACVKLATSARPPRSCWPRSNVGIRSSGWKREYSVHDLLSKDESRPHEPPRSLTQTVGRSRVQPSLPCSRSLGWT